MNDKQYYEHTSGPTKPNPILRLTKGNPPRINPALGRPPSNNTIAIANAIKLLESNGYKIVLK